MKSEKTLFCNKLISVLLGIVCVISYGVLLWQCFNPAIIGDETFSMSLIKGSYIDIIRNTARDVHPPVYYLILKFVVAFLTPLGVPAVYAGKLASALPVFLLAVISFTTVRRRFGIQASCIFAICLTGMSSMQDYGVCIRMYSWGMLFVTMAYVSAYDLFRTPQTDAPTLMKHLQSGIAFVLYSLLASYTHYFACIAVTGIYLALFIWFLCCDRQRIREWFLYVLASVIGYLPWLTIALRQVMTVREGYWIEDITFDTLLSYFQFLFNPSVYRYYSGTILGFFLFALILFASAAASLRKIRGEQRIFPDEMLFFSLTGIAIPFWEILIGVVTSVLIRPVFSSRYIFVSAGALWLGFSILMAAYFKNRSQKRTVFFSLFLLLILCINTKGFMKRETEFRDGWNTLQETLNPRLTPGDVLLSNFGQVRLSLSYAYPQYENCYYWRQKTEDLFKELYGNLNDTRDEEAILAFLRDDNAMYFVDAYELPEFHFQKDCTDPNVIFEELAACLIEDTPVRIYKVSHSLQIR